MVIPAISNRKVHGRIPQVLPLATIHSVSTGNRAQFDGTLMGFSDTPLLIQPILPVMNYTSWLTWLLVAVGRAIPIVQPHSLPTFLWITSESGNNTVVKLVREFGG